MRLSAQQQPVGPARTSIWCRGRRSRTAIPTCSVRTNRTPRSRPATRCTCSPAPTTTAPSTCPARSIRRAASRWPPTPGSACSSRSTAARTGRARCCPDFRRTSRPKASRRRSRAVKARPIRSCAPAPTGCSISPGVAFDRGANKPSAIFVARYMDLNNREAGDPFGYVDTRLVDSDPGTRFLDKVALATDIPRTAATCTITSTQSGDKPGDPPIAHVARSRPGNVYVAYAAFTGSGATEQSVIMISRSTNCGQTWSTPIALSTGLAAGAEPADRRQPDRRRRLRLLAPVPYTSQDDAVMIVKSINGGATFSKPLRVSGHPVVRSADVGHAVPQQRLPDDGDRRHRARVSRLARSRLRGGAHRPGDRRLAHRDLDLDDRRDLVGAARDSAGRRRAPADAGDDVPRRQAAHPLLRPARGRLAAVRAVRSTKLPILNGPTPRIRHTMDVFVAQAAAGRRTGVHHGARLGLRQRLPAGLDRRAAPAVQPARTCRCSGRAPRRSWATTSTSPRRRRSC